MADPELQIRGWGGGTVIQTLRKGGEAVSKKKFFRPFGPQFGVKVRGGGAGPYPGSALKYYVSLPRLWQGKPRGSYVLPGYSTLALIWAFPIPLPQKCFSKNTRKSFIWTRYMMKFIALLEKTSTRLKCLITKSSWKSSNGVATATEAVWCSIVE